MKSRLPMILIASAMAFPVAASAQMAGRQAMAVIDTNGDGMISKDELLQTRAARFVALDTNNDGVLSEAEFAAPAMQVFEALDADGDGQITRAEIRSKAVAARGLFGLAR